MIKETKKVQQPETAVEGDHESILTPERGNWGPQTTLTLVGNWGVGGNMVYRKRPCSIGFPWLEVKKVK